MTTTTTNSSQHTPQKILLQKSKPTTPPPSQDHPISKKTAFHNVFVYVLDPSFHSVAEISTLNGACSLGQLVLSNKLTIGFSGSLGFDFGGLVFL